MPHPVTAKYSFEIEIGLSGTYQPGTYDCGGEPAEPETVEDVEITSIGALTHNYDGDKLRWKTHDLMEGVNVKSPDVQKLLENILAFVEDEAVAELVAEAGE